MNSLRLEGRLSMPGPFWAGNISLILYYAHRGLNFDFQKKNDHQKHFPNKEPLSLQELICGRTIFIIDWVSIFSGNCEVDQKHISDLAYYWDEFPFDLAGIFGWDENGKPYSLVQFERQPEASSVTLAIKNLKLYVRQREHVYAFFDQIR